MLVNHANTGSHGIARTGELLDLVIQQNLSLIGLVQAVENIHQGRLARAIFTQKGVDLTGLNNQVDRVIGHQLAKALGNAAQF